MSEFDGDTTRKHKSNIEPILKIASHQKKVNKSPKKLRNNKAADGDEISGELLKAADNTLIHLLLLFN